MPDFSQLLREKLHRWNCPRRDEVIQELAGHMEDRYEALLRKDIAPSAGLQAALGEVGDWKRLQIEIASARGRTMTKRAKQILIPGMAALLISTVGEKLLWQMRIGTPYVYQYWSWLTVGLPMLCVLLAAGAAAAACSLYSGGNKRQRVCAAEFPALCAFALLLMAFAWGSLLEILLKHPMSWQSVRGVVLRYLVFSVLLPGVALLVGALPFLASKAKSHRVEAIVS